MSIAIASTVLNPPRFFTTWLEYHLLRVHHVLIYMDDPGERELFEEICKAKPVTVFDGSQQQPEMTPESRLIVRQNLNIEHAVSHLLKLGFTWLLHIDIDELLFEPDAESRLWSSSSDAGLVQFVNHEAYALPHFTFDPFSECTWFRVNDGLQEFLGYGNGKSAVRLGPQVKPDGPHTFRGFEGGKYSPGNAVILHYHAPCFETWAGKYSYYGRFSDFWFNDPNPESRNHLRHMLESRDVVCDALENGNWDAAHRFLEKWLLPDESRRKEEIAAGRMRHYSPLNTLARSRPRLDHEESSGQ